MTVIAAACPRALRAVLGGVLAVGLAACTSGEPAPAGPVASAPPNVVPDDAAVATDEPRPAGTDVVLSLVEWDRATASVIVGGYVSPVVEDGGTCTVELERSGQVVRVAAPATPDATTTVCGGLTTDGAELGAGTWTVVLRYESRTVRGSSDPASVEVPA